MATLHDLQLRLSGGASNTSQALALGGAMSTVAGGLVLSQTASAPTTITGVTIDDAAGNSVGTGTLTYTVSGAVKSLRWTPPGGTAGTAVDVAAGGTFAIQGGNNGGYLKVTVAAGSLSGSSLTNTITIANQTNKMFDDVSKAESLAGDTEYRGFYVKNNHGTDTLVGVKLWIGTNTPGQDTIDIALDPAGLNGTAVTIVDESTAPAGVNFDAANPVDEASSLSIGDLAPGEYYPFWIKRVVPANTTEAKTDNSFRLAFRLYV